MAVGALLDPTLPENALLNVRHKVNLYFGLSNKIDDNLTDNLIDEIVKDIHRRWHPSWTKKKLDIDMPVAGFINLPTDFKKLFEIRNQSYLRSEEDVNHIQYVRGTHYDLEGFNTQSPPKRILRWLRDLTTALSVRIWYYRKQERARGNTSLVDIEPDAIDVVEVGAKMKYMAKKSNLKEYDRLRNSYEHLVTRYIDDDTNPDQLEGSVPYHADYSGIDYSTGEIA